MSIHPVSSANVHAAYHAFKTEARPGPDELKPQKPDKAGQAEKAAKTRPETLPENSTPAGESTQHRGVIRLLEEGHFKGVADVRLRINFFDELSAQATEGRMTAADDGTDALLAEFGTNLDTLTGSLPLTEEQSQAVGKLQEEFGQSLSKALDSYKSGESPDSTQLKSAYTEAFNGFVQGLKDLLQPAPPPETAPTQPESSQSELPTAPADPAPPAPAVDLDAALKSLTDGFNDSLSSLISSLDAKAILPDPAPYEGSGKAYSKFLAIYNELRGISPAPEGDPTLEPAVDAVA